MEIKRLTFAELPQDKREFILKEMEQSPRIKSLRLQVENYRRLGKYKEARKTQDFIQQVKQMTISNLCNELYEERFSVSELRGTLSEAEIARSNNYLSGIMVCCDMIEDCTMMLQSLLKKRDKDFRISTFDKLIELQKECKWQLKDMYEHLTGDFGEQFNKYSDKLKDIIWAYLENRNTNNKE